MDSNPYGHALMATPLWPRPCPHTLMATPLRPRPYGHLWIRTLMATPLWPRPYSHTLIATPLVPTPNTTPLAPPSTLRTYPTPLPHLAPPQTQTLLINKITSLKRFLYKKHLLSDVTTEAVLAKANASYKQIVL